jgi:hypothetical protein
MKDWFSFISATCPLSARVAKDLDDVGFIVIPNLIPPDGLARLSAAYDSAFTTASFDEVRVGTTTNRLADFVNRGPEFDELYTCEPLLKACCHIIGQPFKLSSLLGRTLRPNTPAQELHRDFRPGEERFPLVSFIWMVDEFCDRNGATQFIPGSHNWSVVTDERANEVMEDYGDRIVTACGPAGSLIIYHGSILHEHSANSTDRPRRSIQGAFIPRFAPTGTDFSDRTAPETLARISSLAKYVLNI